MLFRICVHQIVGSQTNQVANQPASQLIQHVIQPASQPSHLASQTSQPPNQPIQHVIQPASQPSHLAVQPSQPPSDPWKLGSLAKKQIQSRQASHHYVHLHHALRYVVSCSQTFQRPLDERRSFTYFCGGGGKGIDGGWYQDVRTVRVRFKYEDLFFSSVPKENSKVSDRCSRGRQPTSLPELLGNVVFLTPVKPHETGTKPP